MKGYVYITSNGTDPEVGENLNDPIFSDTPTLGACMPNIRRFVTRGDYIFVVSGKTAGVQQLVVGGMKVAEKISALAAHGRFPQNRLRIVDGELVGNVIVTPNGRQHALDTHAAETFRNRIKNYIVGSDPVALETPRQIAAGREQTLSKLSEIFGRRGNRVIDIIGRMSKMDERQIEQMVDWLRGIKAMD